MGDDKDYTITIGNASEDIGGWDSGSNITINGMSYSTCLLYTSPSPRD